MVKHAKNWLPPYVEARPAPFTIQVTAQAGREIATLNQLPENVPHVANCLAAIDQFAKLATVPNCCNNNRVLKHNWVGYFRLRVDDEWRVIYSVHPFAKVVRVVRVGKRWKFPKRRGRARGSIYDD